MSITWHIGFSILRSESLIAVDCKVSDVLFQDKVTDLQETSTTTSGLRQHNVTAGRAPAHLQRYRLTLRVSIHLG